MRQKSRPINRASFIRTVGPRNLNELDTAFAELLNARPDALLVTAEAFTRQHLVRILDFANRRLDWPSRRRCSLQPTR